MQLRRGFEIESLINLLFKENAITGVNENEEPINRFITSPARVTNVDLP
jgi:hypothetical protein